MRTQGYFRATDLCVLFVLTSLTAGALVYTVGQSTPSPLINELNPEHLAFSPDIRTVNSLAKVRAYEATILFLGFCWIIGTWWYRRGAPSRQSNLALRVGSSIDYLRDSKAVLLLAAGLIALASSSPWGEIGYLFLVCVSVAIALWFPRIQRISALAAHHRIIWSIIALYVLFFCVPGLLGAPDLTHCNMAALVGIEWHMSMTVGLGDRYSIGEQVFRDFIPHYGYILPALNGLLQSVLGSFSLGDQMRLIRWLQVIFAILAIAAYRLWKPGRPLSILVCLVLVIPELSTLGWPVYQPNSSGWRFLSLPAAVIVLLLCRDRPTRRIGAILGACSGVWVLFVPETGLALTVGNCVFLGCRTERGNVRELLISLGRFLVGFVSAWVAYLAIFRMAAGYWPIPDGLDRAVFLATRNLSGYTGTPLKLDPLPWLIFVHSAYIVLKSSMQWHCRPLSFQTSFRVAIAATLLIWFVYWINRSDRLHLWTHVFLYTFLINVLWERLKMPRLTKRWPGAASLWRPLLLVMIVFPHILTINYTEGRFVLGSIKRMVTSGPSDGVMASGVWLRPDVGRMVLQKAGFVSEQAASRSVLYFTGNSYFVPKLSGVSLRLPSQEIFAETITKEDYRRLVSRVLQLCPDEILFDVPDTDELRASFYGRMKIDLSEQYELAREADGWQVWERKGSSCRRERQDSS
jgi:hypothetical protein